MFCTDTRCNPTRAALLLVMSCFLGAEGARQHGFSPLSPNSFDSNFGTSTTKLKANAPWAFTLAEPECAKAGELIVSGSISLEENKDTAMRRVNSQDLGVLPAGLPTVTVEVTVKSDDPPKLFIEVTDLGTGQVLLNDKTSVSNGLSRSSDGLTLVALQKLSTTLAIRLVAFKDSDRSDDVAMLGDSADWEAKVWWVTSKACKKGGKKRTTVAVRLDHSILMAQHTHKYKVPGVLGVLRRGSVTSIQVKNFAKVQGSTLQLQYTELKYANGGPWSPRTTTVFPLVHEGPCANEAGPETL